MDADQVLTLLIAAVGGAVTFLTAIDRWKQRCADARLHYDRALEKIIQAERATNAMSLDDPLKSELQQNAVDLLFQCLSRRPDRGTKGKALFQLGHILLGQDRVTEAEERLLQATRLNSRHKDALYDLALIRNRQGHAPEAVKYFRRVQKIDSAHEGARSWLQIYESMESDEPCRT